MFYVIISMLPGRGFSIKPQANKNSTLPFTGFTFSYEMKSYTLFFNITGSREKKTSASCNLQYCERLFLSTELLSCLTVMPGRLYFLALSCGIFLHLDFLIYCLNICWTKNITEIRIRDRRARPGCRVGW